MEMLSAREMSNERRLERLASAVDLKVSLLGVNGSMRSEDSSIDR